MKPSKDLYELRETLEKWWQQTNGTGTASCSDCSSHICPWHSARIDQLTDIIEQREREARIDELYHVKPIVHRMGLITYNPRLITLESIVERIKVLKAGK